MSTPQTDPPAKNAGTPTPRKAAPKAPAKPRKATPRATVNRTTSTRTKHGATETAVRAEVAALRKAGEHPSEALAQMAYHLARKLDTDAGLATAAVARELRATLVALTPEKAEDDGDPIADLIAALSSPVEHAAR